MVSGRMTATSCQRHCKSRNVRRNRCSGGNKAGADTSNLPNPYSEFAKICQMVPMVLLVIPTVPGGGSGTTVTGQPAESSSDRASGEIRSSAASRVAATAREQPLPRLRSARPSSHASWHQTSRSLAWSRSARPHHRPRCVVASAVKFRVGQSTMMCGMYAAAPDWRVPSISCPTTAPRLVRCGPLPRTGVAIASGRTRSVGQLDGRRRRRWPLH